MAIRMDVAERQRFEAVAERTGYSLSEVLRLCLRAGLAKAETFPPKPDPGEHAIRMKRENTP